LRERKAGWLALVFWMTHNLGMFVLKIVQQGVYSEIAKHLVCSSEWRQRLKYECILAKLIDVMPTLDVRSFVQVVNNIVGSLGDSASGEFDSYTELGETNKLLQLRRDTKELLPEERIASMNRDTDEWAAKQKARLLEQRNRAKKLLKSATETEHFDDEVESLRRKGRS
jgi:hypothetical protein